MGSVFVSGTWRDSRAAPYAAQARHLGESIAEAGFDLVCGPGTGISRPVIDGYRSVLARGTVTFYLPRRELMDAVGEVVGDGADQTIETDFDYPMRNTWQISQCDGVFIITGGDGTLEEALPALIDYALPVAVVQDSGPAALALAALLPIFPDWSKLLVFGTHVEEMTADFLRRVAARADHK